MAEEYIISYPKANPLQMLPQRTLPSTMYQGRHYDEWWFTEQLKPWQGTHRFYNQKAQQGDPLTIEWHANSNAELAYLQIVSQCGQVVYEISASATSVSGHEITSQVSGNSFDAYTYVHDSVWAGMGLDDGIYYVVLKNSFLNPDDPNADADGFVYVLAISEPIWLREEHPHTYLIHYKHSKNKEDVFYSHPAVGISFVLRVEAWIHNLTPQSVTTSYEDEQVDVTPLHDTPYETATFTARRVPEWMGAKLNRAFAVDMVRIDSPTVYYTKDKDAKWEVNYNANRALHAYSISIRKAKNYFSQQFQANSAILVWEVLNNGDSGGSTRFPYFVHSARVNRSGALPVHLMQGLNGTSTGLGYNTDCLEVRNVAHEQTLLDHANNITRVMYQQTGYYSLVTTSGGDVKLIYNPGSNETNYTSALSVVLTRNFKIGFGIWGGDFNHIFEVRGSYIGYGWMRGDGARRSRAYGAGNGGVTHTVSGDGNVPLGDGNVSRIYHHMQNGGGVNTITTFKSVNNSNITGYYDSMPEELFSFTSRYSSQWTTQDAGIFNLCQATLFRIDMYLNTNFGSIVAGSWSANYANEQMEALRLIEVSRCKFTPTTVDAFLNEIYNGGGSAGTIEEDNGEMYIDLQNPAAPPTAASAAAQTYIGTSKSWILQTD